MKRNFLKAILVMALMAVSLSMAHGQEIIGKPTYGWIYIHAYPPSNDMTKATATVSRGGQPSITYDGVWMQEDPPYFKFSITCSSGHPLSVTYKVVCSNADETKGYIVLPKTISPVPDIIGVYLWDMAWNTTKPNDPIY